MEVRIDELTGEEVVVVGHREDRPNLPSGGCPFCVGGREAPEPYDVRAFPNRWPTFPDGRCEVVLYSPDHDASFASLGVEGVRGVIDLWAERTAELGGRDDVAYVLVFENRGEDVGATIAHPHGQIYAYDSVPPVPARELARAADSGCALCREPAEELVVEQHGGWRVWVPHASAHPYGLLLAPDVHVGDLPELDDPSRTELAAALVGALGRLDRLFDQPMPYMLWIHQRPHVEPRPALAHLHVHVTPLLRGPGVIRYVAGAELGAGTMINGIVPEDAAAALREAR